MPRKEKVSFQGLPISEEKSLEETNSDNRLYRERNERRKRSSSLAEIAETGAMFGDGWGRLASRGEGSGGGNGRVTLV